MKQFLSILAAIWLFAATAISTCASGTAREVEGNWYCEAVDGIRYTNVGRTGRYRDVNAMNPDGSCSSTWKTFDGPISPLNEEVRNPQFEPYGSHTRMLIYTTGFPSHARSNAS